MKKIYNLLLCLLVGLCLNISSAFAVTEQDVKAFFDKYVNTANSYQNTLSNFYATNAKILRYVIQKDGTVYPKPLIVGTTDYMGQLKINAKLAKLRNYKNYYKDIKITKIGNDFKVSANRTPSTSPNDKMKAHFVIGTDASGKLVIKEEMMQTREQIFLTQIKKQQGGK